MIRDPGGHRRGGLAPGMRQTRMRRTKIVDRADQIHAMLQRQRAPRQRPASACQRGQPLSERRVQAFDIGRVNDSAALRAAPQRLDASRCPVDNTPFDGSAGDIAVNASITTGTFVGTVFDRKNSTGTTLTDTLTGVPFGCANIDANVLNVGKIGAGATILDLPSPLNDDGVASITIRCQ